MPREKQTRVKKKLVRPRNRAPADPAALLAKIAKIYTFSPQINKRISDTLAQHALSQLPPPVPPVPPPINPLDTPPAFLGRHGMPASAQVSVMDGVTIVRLGDADGHPARIARRHSGEVVFKWGCSTERSEADARRHWSYGYSNRSHAARPNSTALVDYVAAVTKYLGWPW